MDKQPTPHLYVHKTRLHVNNKQRSWCAGSAGFSRFAYNWALNWMQEEYKNGNKRTVNDAAKAFNAAKNTDPELSWIKDSGYSSVVSHSAIVKAGLKNAFKNFFEKRAKYPKFKSRFKSRDSFYLNNTVLNNTHINGNRIKLPKRQGYIRLGSSPKHEGRLLSTTISRTGNKWYGSFTYELDKPMDYKQSTGQPIGLDVGITNFVTDSNGEFHQLPEKIKKLQHKKKILQRKLKNKQGPNRKKEILASRQYIALKDKIRQLDADIAFLRREAQHQLSAKLTKEHSVVVVEDLAVKNMSKSAKGTTEKHGKNVKAKSGLNRELLNGGFGELRRQLEYKTDRHNGTMLAVNPQYTSRICNNCGHEEVGNRRKEKFKCLQCGHESHADVNAAMNILNRGLSELAANGVDGVRLTPLNDSGEVNQ